MDGARAATEWPQHHMHWNLIDGTTALRASPLAYFVRTNI